MRFEGERVAPVTRAQGFQWYLEKGFVTKAWKLPSTTTIERVQTVLADLEERFETLRTVFESVDGEVQQVVRKSGPPLQVVDLPVDTEFPPMQDLLRDFDQNCHARLGVTPIQFYLYRQKDQPCWVVMISDHVIMDGWSAGLLERYIDWANTGPNLAAMHEISVLHPADLGITDGGSADDTERVRGRAHLEHHFATMPGNCYRPHPSSAGEFFRCSLLTDSGGDLFRAVLRKTDTLPSAAVLAAFLSLVGSQTGRAHCSVNVSVQNRHNARLRAVVGTTAQRLPIMFPTRADGFRRLAKRVQHLLDVTLTSGRYDPLDLVGVQNREQLRRGMHLSTDIAFNFRPPPSDWTRAPVGSDRPRQHRVTFGTTDETSYDYGASLSVSWHTRDLVELSLHGSYTALPKRQGVALLQGIVELLRRMTSDERPITEDVAASVGLPRTVPSPGWQRIRETWVNLEHLRDLLLEYRHVEDVALVVPRHAPDRLVARVRVNSAADVRPADLHHHLQDHLGQFGVTLIPDWYELSPLGGSGDGRTTESRPVSTAAETAVLRGMELAHSPKNPSIDTCYIEAGGDLRRYPKFLTALADLGYEGLDLSDLIGTRTLRHLATKLRPRNGSPSRPA